MAEPKGMLRRGHFLRNEVRCGALRGGAWKVGSKLEAEEGAGEGADPHLPSVFRAGRGPPEMPTMVVQMFP